MNMIGDIVERDTSSASASAPVAPSASKASESKLGRKWRTRKTMNSQMERQNAAAAEPSVNHDEWIAPGAKTKTNLGATSQTNLGVTDPNAEPGVDDEQAGIEQESMDKLAHMSSDEVAEMQRELAALDPRILASLRLRGEKKQQQRATPPQSSTQATTESTATTKSDMFARRMDIRERGPEGSEHKEGPAPNVGGEPGVSLDSEEGSPESSLEAADAQLGAKPGSGGGDGGDGSGSGAHFPHPPDDLKKYFPDLPVETDKLAWMTPITEAEDTEYSAELRSVSPSELRFDFRGNLLTPRMSRVIPVSKGLHHHGDAPSAAGYTILELGHLARSSHPAQRSIAIQTAGRVLHKLRRGQYAKSSDLQEGLQDLVRASRLMETLNEAASESTRSLTVRTLATEALWLANTNGQS